MRRCLPAQLRLPAAVSAGTMRDHPLIPERGGRDLTAPDKKKERKKERRKETVGVVCAHGWVGYAIYIWPRKHGSTEARQTELVHELT